jgi:hypothetical protein
MGISKLGIGNNSKVEIKIAHDNWIVEVLENEFPKLDFMEEVALKKLSKVGKETAKYLPETLNNQMIEIITYCDVKLEQNDSKLFLRKLFENYNEKLQSPFGIYKMDNGNIEVYLLPIIIYCQTKNIDFETFFIITLSHELAHLYTHLGLDKDNELWDNFVNTDNYILEGLAQYYTREFINSIEEKIPDAKAIFKQLEENLSDCYTWYRNWNSSLEQTYFSFIETRRNNIIEHGEFLGIIENSKRRIKYDFFKKLF